MINYIRDTFYELWQYLKPQGNVYIAGIKYKDYYILTRMIPEHVKLPSGYEQLTQAMPKVSAEKRLTHFKLIKLVSPKTV